MSFPLGEQMFIDSDGQPFAPALRYLSPRFHPWQHDNRDLLRLWLERNDGAYRAISSTPS